MPSHQTTWVIQMLQMAVFREEEVGVSMRDKMQEIIRGEDYSILVLHLSLVVHNMVKEETLVVKIKEEEDASAAIVTRLGMTVYIAKISGETE